MIIIYIFLLIVLLNICAHAWKGATWGMTPEQVVAALNGEPKQPVAGKYVTANILLEMKDVVIEKEKFTAEFLFTGDKKLIEVNLTSHAGSDDLFYAVEQRLIEKYGKAGFTVDKTEHGEATNNKDRRRAWNKRPTRVELTLFQLIDPEKKQAIVSNLTIRYSKFAAPDGNL